MPPSRFSANYQKYAGSCAFEVQTKFFPIDISHDHHYLPSRKMVFESSTTLLKFFGKGDDSRIKLTIYCDARIESILLDVNVKRITGSLW
jgi:hypothetical protein